MDSDTLIDWYGETARDLPWRRPEVTAWQILMSEIMLQQTPVVRVEPIWREWVARWPVPSAMAAAPQGEVLRAWGKLGYPRRALRRGPAEERFQQLSLGTREQLAVVVRLALARLLQDKEGQSPCLVLDDALVYADEARLEVMKTILQQAGRDQQILILTCRPRDYRGLEARFLRLEDCRG